MKDDYCMSWQGDVFSPDTWRDQLKGAVGVISTLGAFGNNDFMYRFARTPL